MSLRVSLIDPPIPQAAWQAALPYLHKSIAESPVRLSADDFLRLIDTAQMQLWLGTEHSQTQAAMITELVDYPLVKVCRAIHLGAENGAVQPFLKVAFNEVMRWARANGCNRFELVGRLGWQRMLSEYGFEAKTVHMEKIL